MIRGVSEHMHQRVANLIDNCTVQLGVLTCHVQFHFLVELLGQIPDHTRELRHNALNWNHSNLHHRFVEVRCHTLKIFNLFIDGTRISPAIVCGGR